jgi:hypothetical protein
MIPFVLRVELYPPVTAWNSETAPHDASHEHSEHEDHFAQHKLQSLDQSPPPKPPHVKGPIHDKIFFSIGFVSPQSLPSIDLFPADRWTPSKGNWKMFRRNFMKTLMTMLRSFTRLNINI